MTNAQILGFCAACLAAIILLSALIFPHAAMTSEHRTRLNSPQQASSMDAIDLGRVYGKVPVSTLLDEYLTKKAEAGPSSSSDALPQFGGC